MKLAANLSSLWPDLPYLDRFDAAAEAGFDGVEVLFPYEMPAKETQRALMRSGLPMVMMAAPPPNYTGGARGFAAVPEAADRFRYDLRRALRYCEALRTPVLHLLAGVAKGEAARETLVQNLRIAADTAPENMLVTIGPSNTSDLPGAFLDSFDLAADVLREVAAPNLGLLFNSRDAQIMEGNPAAVVRRHAGVIRHVHLADAPSGDVDPEAVAAVLRDEGYRDWIGVLYAPTAQPEDHLALLQKLRG